MKIFALSIGMIIIMPLAVNMVVPHKAQAALFGGSKGQACGGVALDGATTTCEDNSVRLSNIVKNGLNVFTAVVGIISIIFIIIGGVKYITSSGEANNITSAKNTIMYSIVGLIVVALAQVIVKFVLNKVTESPANPPATTSTTSTTPNQFVYNNILKY